MNSPFSLSLLFAGCALFSSTSLPLLADPSSQVYELRTYQAHPGKLEALQARFRDHTVPLFAQHGMTNLGYWTPLPNPGHHLVYLLAYPSRAAREESWKAFLAGPAWKAAHAASIAQGEILASISSEFLSLTPYSPSPQIEAGDPAQLFELRRYTTHEGKLADLDARFRDHTISLFAKHGMTNIAYFHLLPDQPGHETTLLYFLAHRDEAAKTASFAAFQADPLWQAARQASEENGKILVPQGVHSTLLIPTDYSPLR